MLELDLKSVCLTFKLKLLTTLSAFRSAMSKLPREGGSHKPDRNPKSSAGDCPPSLSSVPVPFRALIFQSFLQNCTSLLKGFSLLSTLPLHFVKTSASWTICQASPWSMLTIFSFPSPFLYVNTSVLPFLLNKAYTTPFLWVIFTSLLKNFALLIKITIVFLTPGLLRCN